MQSRDIAATTYRTFFKRGESELSEQGWLAVLIMSTQRCRTSDVISEIFMVNLGKKSVSKRICISQSSRFFRGDGGHPDAGVN